MSLTLLSLFLGEKKKTEYRVARLRTKCVCAM